ncbi:peptidoglycan DD-metalloendopeptidase family protein [Streptomyces sp. NPDC001443]
MPLTLTPRTRTERRSRLTPLLPAALPPLALAALPVLALTAPAPAAPPPTARASTAILPTSARADAPPGPSGPVPALARVWPVGLRPRVLRGWEPPATDYGPGHRGADLAAEPGVPVRAVAAGRVSFAGRVAGRGVVAVELTGTGEPPLRTTYEPVRPSVAKGDLLSAADQVGTVEATGGHCPVGCVHWGLLRGRDYLDPLSLLPPRLLRRGLSRLLPVLGVPLPP